MNLQTKNEIYVNDSKSDYVNVKVTYNENKIPKFKKINDKTIEVFVSNETHFGLFGYCVGKIIRTNKTDNLSFDIDEISKIYSTVSVEDILNTIIVKIVTLSNNHVTFKKTQTKSKFNFMIKDEKDIKEKIELFQSFNIANNLSILPAFSKSTELFEKTTKELFKDVKNVNIKVLDFDEIKKEGMDLMLALDPQNRNHPKLIVIEYFNDSSSKNTKMFVGKGILMDTGGYSIKTGGFMEGMHLDMVGASSVLAATHSIAKEQIKTNLVSIIPVCKNMIDSGGMVPGDVFKTCDGTSIEVVNTDAEGRLILADGICYGKKHYSNIDEVVTVATLTGASSIMFGEIFIPSWCSKDKTWQSIEKAAIKSGETAIRCPLLKEFVSSFETSHIADYKNLELNDRSLSNSKVAAWLWRFTDFNNFVHLDIAGSNEVCKFPFPSAGLTLYNLIKDQSNG